ncbi:MAG: alpha/beta hydrolase [Betaproteobacteria bacterium]
MSALTPNTHHLVGGGSHPVLVMHGWFGDAHAFAPMEPALTTDEFTYAFMDCRGYGGMRDARGAWTIDEIATDAIALADHLGFAHFSLVGHSMGGMVVQRILSVAPDRVRRLVAVTPVPASGVPFDDDGWKLFDGAADNPDNRFAIIDYTTGNRLSRAWISKLVDYSLEHSSRDAIARYLQAWAKTDFSAEVSGMRLPVKVIVGEHDPALNTAVMQATFLASYVDCELEVMANAGHYPMHETPVALATSIENFLRR